MQPRDVARISILVSVGAVTLALAMWMLRFGLGGDTAASASPISLFVVLMGLAVLVAAVAILGGAGADAVWGKLQDLRGSRDRRA